MCLAWPFDAMDKLPNRRIEQKPRDSMSTMDAASTAPPMSLGDGNPLLALVAALVYALLYLLSWIRSVIAFATLTTRRESFSDGHARHLLTERFYPTQSYRADPGLHSPSSSILEACCSCSAWLVASCSSWFAIGT